MALSSLTLGGFFVPLNRGKLSEQPSLPFSFQVVQYILGAPVLGATSVWSESSCTSVLGGGSFSLSPHSTVSLGG